VKSEPSRMTFIRRRRLPTRLRNTLVNPERFQNDVSLLVRYRFYGVPESARRNAANKNKPNQAMLLDGRYFQLQFDFREDPPCVSKQCTKHKPIVRSSTSYVAERCSQSILVALFAKKSVSLVLREIDHGSVSPVTNQLLLLRVGSPG
jgi:hypothetical protein